MKRRGSNCALDKVPYRCDERVQRWRPETDKARESQTVWLIVCLLNRWQSAPRAALVPMGCWQAVSLSRCTVTRPSCPPSTAVLQPQIPATGYPATLPMLLCVSPVHL